MDVALKAVCKWEMQSGYITVMSGCVFVCAFFSLTPSRQKDSYTNSAEQRK